MTSRNPRKIVDSRDVAALAGVSQSTVSRVLSRAAGIKISDATRERVLEAAYRLNYVPNSQMREFRLRRSNRVGVVLTHGRAFGHMDPYHAGLLGGIMAEASQQSLNVLLYTSATDSWGDMREDVLGGSSEGVVVVGSLHESDMETSLHRVGHPTVYVSVLPESLESFFAVDCDNYQGVQLAMQHLRAAGAHHILYMEPRTATERSYTRERRQGVKDLLQIWSSESIAPNVSFANADRLDELIEVLAQHTNVDAVFFALSEALARRFVDIAPDVGYSIPDQLMVCSFDGTEFSRTARVPITSVRQSLVEIGQTSLRLLNQILGGDDPVPGVRRIPVTLEVRDSTRRS
jgi:LacI family transcriptional regulator